MSCASSCQTQDHETFGECVRSQGQMVAYCNSANGRDYSTQKRLDAGLQEYRDARAQGVQPEGSSPAQVKTALAISDKTGTAFRA